MTVSAQEPACRICHRGCGCVQIRDVPSDLSPYYPAGYFVYRGHSRLARMRLRAVINRARVASYLWGGGAIGRLVDRVAKPFDYVPSLRTARVGPYVAVLGVGCILTLIPLAGSNAFETCREQWMQRDAPRHLYRHTRTSVAAALNQAGRGDQAVFYLRRV